MILGIRVGRRLLAAAALDGEHVTFSHSRFTPRRTRVADLATSYFRQLLNDARPAAVYYRAVKDADSIAAQVAGVLEREAAQLGIVAKSVSVSDLLGSFGIRPVRTRGELRGCVAELWPDLTQSKTERQPIVAEALAVAMVGEFEREMQDV